MSTINPVDIGAAPDDGTGDPLRTAYNKINGNEANLNADKLEAPVSLSDIQDVATQTITGRISGGSGSQESLTAAQARSVLNVADGATDDTTVNNHIADASGAHAASAVSYSPTGTIAATDVQAAVAEVAAEAPLISNEDELVGQMQIAVVAALPGTPDANTIYFVTT